MHINVHAYTYIPMYICPCVYIHMYICMHICNVHLCIYIHVCLHGKCVTQGWFKTIYLSYSCTGCFPSTTEIAESHLDNIYWRYCSVLICWRWSYSLIFTLILGLLYQKKHPNNNKVHHLDPYSTSCQELTTSEIDNIQYEIIKSLPNHSIKKSLPEDQCTVHYQIDVYSLKSSCVVYFRIWHMFIYSFKEDPWCH